MANGAYAQLLSTAPGSCTAIRKELASIHGVKISGSTYNSVWRSLVDFFGHQGAAKLTEDIVDIRTARTTLARLGGKRDQYLFDSLLIEKISKTTRRGRASLRKTLAKPTADVSVGRKTRKRFVSHDHIKLPSVEYGCGMNKTSALAYRPIERQSANGSVPIKGRSDWLEKHLENYLENKWSDLDFGLGLELILKGRQVRLSETNEKVDLLAQMGEVVIPIELKIKRAGGADLTQLQSYRKDLINRGHDPVNVLGILVAPQFSSKILNVVHGVPGIILRWFEIPL